MTNKAPSSSAEKKVYFCYDNKEEKKKIIDYMTRLEKIMFTVNPNYKLTFTQSHYTIIHEYGIHKNEYIALTPNALSVILEYQCRTAVPSLQELTFRKLAKIPHLFEQRGSNGRRNGLIYARNIANRLMNEAKENKIDLNNIERKEMNQEIFQDPRFLFFSYPHLKEKAFQKINQTVDKILINKDKVEKKQNTLCSLQ
ncbi:MAG: hypothetical protein HKM04_03125 [Legionellales bacterium]|nr:hypothetical protein [Legionellales bacterium]